MPPTYSFKWRLAQWLELKWWQNYLKSKNIDQYLAWKKKYWHEFLDSITPTLPIAQTNYILDAGCGPAGIFTIFPANNVTALDPLLEQYEQQLPHFKRHFYPNVRFLPQPIETLAETEVYDTVFCLNAINHVSNIHTALSKLLAALKPGGYIVLSIDAHNFTFLRQLFRLIPADALHPHQFTLQDYQDMLLQHGVQICATKCLHRAFIFNYWVIVAQKI